MMRSHSICAALSWHKRKKRAGFPARFFMLPNKFSAKRTPYPGERFCKGAAFAIFFIFYLLSPHS